MRFKEFLVPSSDAVHQFFADFLVCQIVLHLSIDTICADLYYNWKQ